MTAGQEVTTHERFALRYFILCDDARQELSKKVTLVGVYTDMVVVPTESVQLPGVAFVFSFSRLTDELPRSGTFRLDGPNGVVLQETTFTVLQQDPEFRTTNMIIHATGVTLTAGGYRAVFRVNNSAEFVGDFTVRHDPAMVSAIMGERQQAANALP